MRWLGDVSERKNFHRIILLFVKMNLFSRLAFHFKAFSPLNS